ncbi:uncharacterized protein LOC115963698 isoform X2 [Quercus lobata]|uniref:uncharacterized protein LOC115963698 isoform X2 n=1 Tax=Quercus lobata TaxID=97700 RepID=UPI0012487665|nr:uncharacterized protein LOC115963698 isoform X2 [Quercus lobata]
MSCLVQLSLYWQLTRFYHFFFCSLLGPATTSIISQHQQNWPRRIISFILGSLLGTATTSSVNTNKIGQGELFLSFWAAKDSTNGKRR